MSALFIFLVIIAIASGDNSVHLLDYPHQYVTSSTLNWLPVGHYDLTKTIVVGGFRKIEDQNGVKKERQMFVCRASHKAAWVAGTQLEGEKQCTVTFLGSVSSYDRYELLENVENAARLSWLSWDKYQQIPSGAVATDTMFIARHVSNDDNGNEDGTSSKIQYIGTLDKTSNLGTITYVKDNGTEESVTEGEILVETEPIYYELKSIKSNLVRKRVNKLEPKILGEATISNSRNEPAKLAEAFGYSYKYFSYWGQGHGMIKALNTSITLDNGTRLYDIAWGIDGEPQERTGVYTVEIYLQPGTAVNVTLKANYTDFEALYTGQLVSHYEDGETRTRGISGMRHEITMMDLKPEFGPIYFLSNLSIVPTTLAPPTTRGTTGTTSGSTLKPTTFSSASNNINTNDITSGATTASEITKNDDDENMILPPRKTDMSNIQNDDGGPLSLKNKEDPDRSSSNIFHLSVTIILMSFLVNLYQIT
ncbi:hypothetical protein PV325_009933 [Microctonus aethiopoides]|nr:hypothetical protein PV325_009933 [Microctonus aethiopoides]